MEPTLQPAFCGDDIVYPSNVNVTLIRRVLCDTNITLLETELKKMINFQEILKLVS